MTGSLTQFCIVIIQKNSHLEKYLADYFPLGACVYTYIHVAHMIMHTLYGEEFKCNPYYITE